jgi:large subunit ribosomal protein L10
MKTRAQKADEVTELKGMLDGTPHVFLTAFSKLTVDQDYKLRKTVRAAGGRYKVIKNTLARIASAGTPSEPILKGLEGMNSIAFTKDDPVALAKALRDYAKENPTFTFRGGVVDSQVFQAKDIEALATMPSKEEIFAKLLYVINAPAQQLVTAINGVGRNLAVVIDQGVKENKFSA